MSQPHPAQSAKLVIALLLRDKALISQVVSLLQTSYGDLDLVSPWFDFDYTDYYTCEMGTPLYRRILVFRHLIAQQHLARIKRQTNMIEQNLAVQDQRRVNIDPGYLLCERFVLATGKNYAHRIYIGEGIYADLTLIYQGGDYQPLPWTYPDYRATEMRMFLSQVRRMYSADLKCQANGIRPKTEHDRGQSANINQN